MNSIFVLAGLLGSGLVLWLLLWAIRRKMQAGGSRASAREASVLLGALFGFPAGLWIYDKLCPCSEKASVSDTSQKRREDMASPTRRR